ncbi:MAG: hypothetical protein H7Y22_11620 [Gemmatimonadaceae bacterium]|nr:hypothetical protein [Gloeobacterales cyanobacterium ES-bin-141]
MLARSDIANVRRLIWIYFWLLIIEGALRKWFLPQLSTPLLVVRDPVVILAYYFAFRAGILPKDRFSIATLALALISFPAGLLATVIEGQSNISVVLFGLRTNFLHLPFIFLIAKVFTLEDVKALGRWVLIISVPMTILMIFQFRAGPDDFLNRGIGETGRQIISTMGKIRPAGTFSFISGPALFYAVVTAFITYGYLNKRTYPDWLLGIASVSTVSALVVSGSRSTVGAVGVVFACLGVGILARPRLVGGAVRLALIVGIAVFGVSYLPFFGEAYLVTSTRFDMANTAEGGILPRFLTAYTAAFDNIFDVPLLGRGLGMGTNGGAALLGSAGKFLLAETEWPRVIQESGPVLGLMFITLRALMVAWMGKWSFKAAAQGDLLPLLLFGTGFLNLLNGQFGQPTSLGFAVLMAGLCIASLPQVKPVQVYQNLARSGLAT